MKLPRRNFLHLAAGAAALLAVSRTASAQAYPSRPITMIVPFPAGGPLDTIAHGRQVMATRSAQASWAHTSSTVQPTPCNTIC
jgi:tripartite-type tricarboxylate transporter receptor subunit TctC